MTRPLVQFVLGGVQKGGTSALAHYLGRHPSVRLPHRKEGHVFDDPAFDDQWSPEDIDARFSTLFDTDAAAHLCGDATPIYVFVPRVVARIARYNPAMRWIVLLRDPVERAISHYHMERARGQEHWPLSFAMLLERWRLHGHEDDLSWSSPLRTHSYLARGDYAGQLDVLARHFPARQVLVLESAELRSDLEGTLAKAWTFLGVEPPPSLPEAVEVFAGNYTRPGRHSPSRHLVRWLLRKELERMRTKFDLARDVRP